MSKTPGLNLPFGIDPVNPVPVDSNYGPYISTAQAIASIPLALRYDGLTVQITGMGNFWWEASDLSDLGLKPKSTGTGTGTTIINNNNSGDTGKVFYLVPSVPSDIPGYFLASESPSAGPSVSITQTNINTNDNLIASFITAPNVPDAILLPTGIASRVIHGMVGATNETARYKLELYKRDLSGTETLLRDGYSHNFNYDTKTEIVWNYIAATTDTLVPTDRLVFKLYTARVSGPTTVTVTTYFEGDDVSYVKTTLTGNSIKLPTYKAVYLVDNAADLGALGGAANNVYMTAQEAYDAANALQQTLPFGTYIDILVGVTNQANVGDIVLTSDWNGYVRINGLNNVDSQIGNIIGDNALGNAYIMPEFIVNNCLIAGISLKATGPTGDAGYIAISGCNFTIVNLNTSLTHASNSTGTTGYIDYSDIIGLAYFGNIISTVNNAAASNGGINLNAPQTFTYGITLNGKNCPNNVQLTNTQCVNFAITLTAPTSGISANFINCSFSTFALSIGGNSTVIIEKSKIDNSTITNTNTSLGTITVTATSSILSSPGNSGIFDTVNTSLTNYITLSAKDCHFYKINNLSNGSRLFGCTIGYQINGIGANCIIVDSTIEGGPTAIGVTSILNSTAVTVVANNSYFRTVPQTTVTLMNENATRITKASLATLISTNKVEVGITYVITDAQDALGGTITVRGTSTNTVDGTGQWEFDAKLGAQGKFTLATGNAGSINQITCVTPAGSVNLLASAVPYSTSRNQTALNTVAAINSNTSVSGFRAWAMLSAGIGAFDQPTICIESLSGQTSFVYTMTVNTTTLTTSGLVSPLLGFNTSKIVLKSVYDITNDRITYAYDGTYDISISTTVAKITSLGVNPVTTFRWNDGRFRSWRCTNTLVRNIFFRMASSQTVRNLVLSESQLDGFVTSTLGFGDINLRSGSYIANLNATSVQITNFIGTLTIGTNIPNTGSVDCGGLTISSSICNISISEVAFGNSTTKGNISINLNSGAGSLLLNTLTSTTTLTSNFSNNFISQSLAVQSSSFTGQININFNVVKRTFTIISCTNMAAITILQNTFGSTVNFSSIGFATTGGVSILLISNTLEGAAVSAVTIRPSIDIAGITGIDNIEIIQSTGGINFLGTTVGSIYIDYSYIDPFIAITLGTAATVGILNSVIRNLQLINCYGIDIRNTTIDDVDGLNGNPWDAFTITMVNSTLSGVRFPNLNSVLGDRYLNVINSELKRVNIFPDTAIINPDSYNATITNCKILDSTINLGDSQTNAVQTEIRDSEIINSTVNTGYGVGGAGLTTYILEKSIIKNSQADIRSIEQSNVSGLVLLDAILTDNNGTVAPRNFDIKNLTIKNATFYWYTDSITQLIEFTINDFTFIETEKQPGSIHSFGVDNTLSIAGDKATFAGSRVESGKYFITTRWNPPTNPGVTNHHLITHVLAGFTWKNTVARIYGSMHVLNSALSIGTSGNNTLYFPSTQRITLEATASENSGFNQPLATSGEIRVYGTTENLFKTVAYPQTILAINIEGHFLQQYN